MNDPIERLLAESDIRQLLARYTDAIYRKDFDALATCWAGDGVWHAFGQRTAGRDAIIGWLQALTGMFSLIWQTAHNVVIQIDGDEAIGRIYIDEISCDLKDVRRFAMGIYHDRYARIGGRWCFVERHWDLLYLGAADLSAKLWDMPSFGPPPLAVVGPGHETLPTIATSSLFILHALRRVRCSMEISLRIAIIDDSAIRASVIEAGLREVGLIDLAVLTDRVGLVARLAEIEPDVVLLNLSNPGRDTLEESFLISRSLNRPIAMFVDQSDEEMTLASVDAGVSAYVVDGFRKDRVKPILDLAIRRFNAFARLQAELAEARGEIAEMKDVDEAKRVLMKRRSLSEPEAYKLLRSHAMQSNQRIVDVARAIMTSEQLLGGGP